jgi:sterol 3beta-glucosyltransferase
MHSTSHFRSAILPPLPQMPSPRLARAGNRLSYVLVHEVFWSAFRAPINEVICGLLGMPRAYALPSYTEDNLSAPGTREPVLCGWSPQVLTKPPEWRTDIHVTGYWFLDGHEEWRPPEGLMGFLESGPEPVAIGFGSTTSLDPEGITETITAALRSTGNRAVLLTGWSDLDAVDMPDEIFPLEQAPHDWLFPRVSAAIHHGGSTTTGASLRTGTPTVTIPFWFDQHFWGERVTTLGAGPAPIPARRLTSQNLAEALRIATANTAVRSRAEEVGRAIRQEDGPSAALHALERHGILLYRVFPTRAGLAGSAAPCRPCGASLRVILASAH